MSKNNFKWQTENLAQIYAEKITWKRIFESNQNLSRLRQWIDSRATV